MTPSVGGPTSSASDFTSSSPTATHADEAPSYEKEARQREADQILAAADARKQAKMDKEKQGGGAYEEDVFVSEEAYERAQKGKDKMKQLGWGKMSILLCVEAIALGALSLPG